MSDGRAASSGHRDDGPYTAIHGTPIHSKALQRNIEKPDNAGVARLLLAAKAQPRWLNTQNYNRNQNITEFMGAPLLIHSINYAKKSKLISNIYVSTDDNKTFAPLPGIILGISQKSQALKAFTAGKLH